MRPHLPRLSLNQAMALAALALGIGALLIGNPAGGVTTTIDARELARVVQTEVDHVVPIELADWIIRGKADYRLIDLRSTQEYADYHIPGAENVELASLMDYGLLRNEKVILYSDGGIHSAQAWFLLKTAGYRGAYILLGGLEGWKDDVLFPQPPVSPSPEELVAFERSREVSRFFGGTPRTGTASDQSSATRALPTLEMPSAPAAGTPAGPPTRKKKKEGC
jgi:rhodanese-related sulfurtransferase